MLSRNEVINYIVNRMKALEKIPQWSIVESEENWQFLWKADIAQMPIIDYGRLCEIGLLVHIWRIKVSEITDALKGQK